ncbi:MAG: hypothetical protein ACHQD9_01760 [Chitinophagales bacterium]
MKTILNFSLGSVLVALIAFSACQKNNMSAPNDASTMAATSARIDNESNKVEDAVNSVALNFGIQLANGKLDGGGIISLLPACATVTLDTVSDPHSMVINFGSTPCLCDQWDNRYRQGVVTVTWTGGYRQPGTVISYSTSSYYRGDAADQMDQINFSKTVTNEGLNNAGNLHYSIVTTGSMTTFDGQTSNWSATKDKEWVAGSGTSDPSDDVYKFSGTLSGTNLNGVAYTATITTPLVKNACDWYVSGTVDFTRTNMPTATLDYGNGNCDDQATVTVNGQTKTITLH